MEDRLCRDIQDQVIAKAIEDRDRVAHQENIMGRVKPPFIAEPNISLQDLRAGKQEWSKRLIKLTANVPANPSFAAAFTYELEHNIVGIAVCEKIASGKHIGVTCIKFLVRSKFPQSHITRKHRLPKFIDGLPVDVEEVGTFFSMAQVSKRSRRRQPRTAARAVASSLAIASALEAVNPRTRLRPAPPGCSVGFKSPSPVFQMAGTFGALVRDASGLYILSNNHVLANENELPLGSPIFQQGLKDGGKPDQNHQIASLTNFEPLQAGGVKNKVDCAIARVPDPTLVSNSILHIGPPKGKSTAFEGMEVHKFGRLTNYTAGRVKSIDADLFNLVYRTGLYNFSKQILIEGLGGELFADRGDSGALVLERGSQKAVGLLFALSTNSAGQIFAAANHIDDVLSEMGVALVV